MVEAAQGRAVKVILENAYLTDEQKILGCHLAEEAGAAFVKTSTGYAPEGATLEDIVLMRAAVSPRVGVKAAGGVRTLDALLAMESGRRDPLRCHRHGCDPRRAPPAPHPGRPRPLAGNHPSGPAR